MSKLSLISKHGFTAVADFCGAWRTSMPVAFIHDVQVLVRFDIWRPRISRGPL